MIDYKGVIFDLDGTILDSLHVWKKVDKLFFEKQNLTLPFDYEYNIKSMTLLEAAEYTKKICGIDNSIQEIIEQWKDIAYDEYKNNVALKKGVYEYLLFLKKHNIKMGVATACEKNLYEVCLKANNIYDFFDTIVDSTYVDRGKNYPDIYELCAKNLKLDSKDIIVFEDIIEAVKGAKKASMRVYAVYDKNSVENIEELIKESDEYITDFRELIV